MAKLDTSPEMKDVVFETTLLGRCFPGMSPAAVSSMASLRVLWEQVKDTDPDDVFVFQIDRAFIEAPVRSGTHTADCCAWFLLNLPRKSQGRILLSFQGWADDPRELFEVPEIISFSTRLLYGKLEDALSRKRNARLILNMLLDEHNIYQQAGEDAFQLPGRIWFTSLVHHQDIMMEDPDEPGTYLHNVSKAYDIVKAIFEP